MEVANAQTEKDTLINELSEAKEANLATGRKVSKLQAELADSMAMEATLRQDVDSERSTLDEKTDEFAQIESMLSIPHLTGWHYTANQGWLFTEPGSIPWCTPTSLSLGHTMIREPRSPGGTTTNSESC